MVCPSNPFKRGQPRANALCCVVIDAEQPVRDHGCQQWLNQKGDFLVHVRRERVLLMIGLATNGSEVLRPRAGLSPPFLWEVAVTDR
jgi:hypothetical protein